MLRKEDFEPGVGPWRMSTSEYGDVVLIQDTADHGFQMLTNFRNMEEAEQALKMLNKKWEVKENGGSRRIEKGDHNPIRGRQGGAGTAEKH